jgi:hypothetical protein
MQPAPLLRTCPSHIIPIYAVVQTDLTSGALTMFNSMSSPAPSSVRACPASYWQAVVFSPGGDGVVSGLREQSRTQVAAGELSKRAASVIGPSRHWPRRCGRLQRRPRARRNRRRTSPKRSRDRDSRSRETASKSLRKSTITARQNV